MALPRPPPLSSLLGRHRLLSPTVSIRVIPLCLGGMSLGNNRKAMMVECTKETAFELLDTCYDCGGNFIDTANMYQGGQSEEWIGECMTKTGRRDEMVVATKYALGYLDGHAVQKSNFGGTGTKGLHLSIETSLKRLQTDDVDIHTSKEGAYNPLGYTTSTSNGSDYATKTPELMQSLNALVQQRKLLYLGISDTPAWVVVKANCYARQHGLRPFCVYQGQYSAQTRDLESDVIPMCIDEGMALHPWGVMGSGYFTAPDSNSKEGGRTATLNKIGRETQVSAALDIVARCHSVPITSVALAYVMHKAPYIFPVLGDRKVSHLKANVEALSLRLSAEDVADVEKGYGFDPGFPHNFIGMPGKAPREPGDIKFLGSLGYFDYVQGAQPVKPHEGNLTGRENHDVCVLMGKGWNTTPRMKYSCQETYKPREKIYA